MFQLSHLVSERLQLAQCEEDGLMGMGTLQCLSQQRNWEAFRAIGGWKLEDQRLIENRNNKKKKSLPQWCFKRGRGLSVPLVGKKDIRMADLSLTSCFTW